jgi:hypothetical protein
MIAFAPAGLNESNIEGLNEADIARVYTSIADHATSVSMSLEAS